MEIYIADVRSLAGESVFSAGIKLVPEERQQRIGRYKNRADRLRGLGAGLLLEYGLRRRGLSLVSSDGGRERVELVSGPYGKPYVAGHREVYFNLSHSGDYAAAVFSELEAGIDIEQIGEVRERVACRFFHPEEYAYLKSRSVSERGRIFMELWTKKESYIKAVGEGMHLPLADFSVLGEHMLQNRTGENGKVFYRTFYLPEGYVLSVCTGRAEEVRPEKVKLAGFVRTGRAIREEE